MYAIESYNKSNNVDKIPKIEFKYDIPIFSKQQISILRKKRSQKRKLKKKNQLQLLISGLLFC